MVHSDLCGQITCGKAYFLLVVDDFSRYMWLELLTSKDEALGCLKKIVVAAKVESGHRLKAFRSDQGGEFNSAMVIAFCSEKGIKHYTTMPYSPQRNGVVERRNQTVVEIVRCLLKSMQAPSKFWGEAVKMAVYILNRSPTKSLNQKTPFEAWFGRKPSARHLRTFGCVAYAKRNGPGVTKLADRSILGVFLGYEPGTKGYRVFYPVNEKLMLSRDVVFDEKKLWNWGEKASNSSGGAATPNTFSVQYPDTDTVHCPTTGSDSAPGTDSFVDGAPTPPAATIPLEDGEGSPHTPPHTPIVGNQGSTPPATQIQWASPPSDACADSDGGPR